MAYQSSETIYAKHGPHIDAMKKLLPVNRPLLPASMKVGSRELPVRESDLYRFLIKVKVQPGGEWLWSGKTNRYGYGTFSLGGSGVFVGAHRFAYTALVGPIPDGLDIDHIRHNRSFSQGECSGGPSCPHRREVDPDGLAPKSRSANILEGAGSQGRTMRTGACKWGHALVGENLTISIRNGHPVRVCRACKRRAYHEAVGRQRTPNLSRPPPRSPQGTGAVL